MPAWVWDGAGIGVGGGVRGVGSEVSFAERDSGGRGMVGGGGKGWQGVMRYG